MNSSLFVYGTLCPGRENAFLLNEIGGTFVKAKVKGFFHEYGWGLTGGYPAIVLSDKGDLIDGYLFNSECLENAWPKLDHFEGEKYKRVKAQIILIDGRTIEAFVYILNPILKSDIKF